MENKNDSIFRRLIERISGIKSVFSARWVKPAAILSGCVILLVGCLLLWTNVLSPDAAKSRADAKKVAELLNNIELSKERQRNDTYGGRTPEETLQLFIAALEADDLELASKYFKLNEQGERDGVWLDGLTQAKRDGNIPRFVSDLKLAKRADYSESLGSSTFVVKKNGENIGSILLERNVFCNLWKISGI